MGTALGLPVVHLDRHYWHADWVPTPREEWRVVVTTLAQESEWIMDGNYSGTLSDRLPFADAVVILDVHPFTCLWRAIRRRFERETRADIPDGCPDRFAFSDFTFFWWILTYRQRTRPRVVAMVAAHPEVHVVELRSRAETRHFLGTLVA